MEQNCSCNQNPRPGVITDFGPQPYVTDVNAAARGNPFFRTALWTGSHLQLTLMSIPAGGEIGVEIHPDTDQYIRVEAGMGLVKMGRCENQLTAQRQIWQNDAIFVPAGQWHNIVNVGVCPLKLSSVYAPPHHPHGTVHRTKEEAEAAEH
ncbi:Cupin domain protein [uncultured Eubacteriales bacterium]|uniref:Cupin domain protein n=1 Tax=uncultured Eubacteriales bacterium TaxID=172733 RepID=A0A212KAY4_9FIRM|nr:Cupin domain protein [uncultured Eubacteriales bacterium]